MAAAAAESGMDCKAEEGSGTDVVAQGAASTHISAGAEAPVARSGDDTPASGSASASSSDEEAVAVTLEGTRAESVSSKEAQSTNGAAKPGAKEGPERSNQSFVHKHEQILLNYFVRRLPLWVTPDVLTAIGVLGMVLTGLAYHLYAKVHPAWIHLGSVGLFINWYGDSLDGHCARFRNMSRPNYGFFVDIMADLLGTGSWIVGGIAFCGLVEGSLAVSVFTLFETLVVLDLFRIALAKEQHRVDAAGVSGTEVRMIVMVLHVVLHATGVETGADILTGVLVAFAAFGLIFVLVSSWTFGKELLARDNDRLRATGLLPPLEPPAASAA